MKEISIDEIDGFLIGHDQDSEAATGCTVIICEEGAVCGVDVKGGSPGTRDTDALNPVNNREKVHAIFLSGGSSYGLDAAGGVMNFLEEKNIGRNVRVTVVPNVCAAVLFDLKCGSYNVRPDTKMGYTACKNAFSGMKFISGNYGAGTGATIGKSNGIRNAMKGGIGSFAFQHDELCVGAIVAVNCIGDIYDYKIDKIIAGARTTIGKDFANSENIILNQYKDNKDIFSTNTIIGCVITNADLLKTQSTKLASIAHNGIARVVRPSHTVYDGDTLFTMCTGKITSSLDAVSILAVKAVEYAIIDAVKSAETYEEYISLNDFIKG